MCNGEVVSVTISVVVYPTGNSDILLTLSGVMVFIFITEVSQLIFKPMERVIF
jgi:hypothetical protein